MYKNNGITDTALLNIAIRGVSAVVYVNKQLPNLCNLEGNAVGEDLVMKVTKTLDSLECSCDKSTSFATSGGWYTCGPANVLVVCFHEEIMHICCDIRLGFNYTTDQAKLCWKLVHQKQITYGCNVHNLCI